MNTLPLTGEVNIILFFSTLVRHLFVVVNRKTKGISAINHIDISGGYILFVLNIITTILSSVVCYPV